MNNYEKNVKKLWKKLDLIVKTNVKISGSVPEFLFWHCKLNLSEKNKKKFYVCWGKFLVKDKFDHIRPILDRIYFDGAQASCKPMLKNPFLEYDEMLVPSCTYVHLYQNSVTNYSKQIQNIANQHSRTVELVNTGTWIANFGEIVGLDLVVQDIKSLPEASFICNSAANSHCETNVAVSYMMLKAETKKLRQMVSLLYPVLKKVLHRKLVIDLTIYFLVCDLNRSASAIFIDCCPSSFRREFQKNLFIPLRIPFHQKGYWLRPNLKINTNEKLQLVVWENNNSIQLKETYNQWYFQMFEEEYQKNQINDSITFNFQWQLLRTCLLIQSSEKIAEIEFTLSNCNKKTFVCKNPEQILILKDNFYWYNISLLATHDHIDALFSTTLYHARVMQARMPFYFDNQSLTVKLTNPLTQIRIYSRMLNELAVQVATITSIPRFVE